MFQIWLETHTLSFIYNSLGITSCVFYQYAYIKLYFEHLASLVCKLSGTTPFSLCLLLSFNALKPFTKPAIHVVSHPPTNGRYIGRVCFQCGRKGHIASTCHFTETVCSNCKKGHLAVCVGCQRMLKTRNVQSQSKCICWPLPTCQRRKPSVVPNWYTQQQSYRSRYLLCCVTEVVQGLLCSLRTVPMERVVPAANLAGVHWVHVYWNKWKLNGACAVQRARVGSPIDCCWVMDLLFLTGWDIHTSVGKGLHSMSVVVQTRAKCFSHMVTCLQMCWASFRSLQPI